MGICKICGNEFIDNTYNHNKKYCSKKCRILSRLQYNREYMRKIRLGLYRLGKPNNRAIGTINEYYLDVFVRNSYEKIKI